jgi:hypothetical protein
LLDIFSGIQNIRRIVSRSCAVSYVFGKAHDIHHHWMASMLRCFCESSPSSFHILLGCLASQTGFSTSQDDLGKTKTSGQDLDKVLLV